MGFKKVFCLILFFVLFTGCSGLLAKKEIATSLQKYPPLPELIGERKLIILPFENLSLLGRYDLYTKAIPSVLYSFLRFVDTYPYDLELVTLKNAKAFYEGFGALFSLDDPSPSFKAALIRQSLKTNGTKKDFDAKKYALPDFFALEPLSPNRNYKTHLKDNPLILKGEVTEKLELRLYLYDPIIDKRIQEWSSPLPPISMSLLSNQNDLKQMILVGIKPFLEQLAGKTYYPVKVSINPEAATLYVNGNYVDTKTILLPAGNHQVKGIKVDYETYQAQFDLKEEGSLAVEMKALRRTIPVVIETSPPGSPVFVDADFVGLSPVSTLLSDGTHQVRVSREGFEHHNTMLKLYSFDTEKKLLLTLKPENKQGKEDQDQINFYKNLAFYSFFPMFGAYLYTEQRTQYYSDKMAATVESATHPDNSGAGLTRLNDKFQMYNTATQFFRNGSIMLLITAAILQGVELEMDDVGIGVDQDKRLGVYIKW